ncbi:hypothetical protein [Sporosalibacterium faouarense]|uniref:hypothetical protein n=1 Tax=Sporosalibacterium faouarense TaxID=516123 RepID=UPI00141C8684|nr:hypothetical protein [Sporosalibacterium faouarense]MTI49626.1 hypothetical protein [Bacillota bacterium]
MKKVSQEDVLNLAFTKTLNREELLIKKYESFYRQTNNKEIKKILKALKSTSKEHIKLSRELMSNLNIQISGRMIK